MTFILITWAVLGFAAYPWFQSDRMKPLAWFIWPFHGLLFAYVHAASKNWKFIVVPILAGLGIVVCVGSGDDWWLPALLFGFVTVACVGARR